MIVPWANAAVIACSRTAASLGSTSAAGLLLERLMTPAPRRDGLLDAAHDPGDRRLGRAVVDLDRQDRRSSATRPGSGRRARRRRPRPRVPCASMSRRVGGARRGVEAREHAARAARSVFGVDAGVEDRRPASVVSGATMAAAATAFTRRWDWLASGDVGARLGEAGGLHPAIDLRGEDARARGRARSAYASAVVPGRRRERVDAQPGAELGDERRLARERGTRSPPSRGRRGVGRRGGRAGAASATLAVSAEMSRRGAHQLLPERSTFTVVLTLMRIGTGTWKPLHGWVGMPGGEARDDVERCPAAS